MRLDDLKPLNENDETETEKAPDGQYGSYRVRAGDMEGFTAGLAKINQKAKRYGVPELTISSKERFVDKKNNEVFYVIKVKGQPVKFQGWEFLATIEHTDKANNVIRGIPGYNPAELKQYLQSSNKNCDFCHSQRDRNQTYIIRKVGENDDPSFKQVGGQCLKKFLGDEARKLVRYAFGMADLLDKLLEDDDDGYSFGGHRRGKSALDALPVLSSAAALVRAFGFKKAGEWSSTSSIVKVALYGYGYGTDPKDYGNRSKEVDMVKVAEAPEPADVKHAEDALAWFNSLPDTEKEASDYMFSLKSVIEADFVTARSVGLLASLIPVFARKQAEPKPVQGPGAKPSEWVGTEGAKIPPMKVRVVFTQVGEGDYGTYQIVKMEGDDGNIYLWYNTGRNQIENGAIFTIVGTVKKHNEFKGVKSTVLTRPKITK